MFCSLARFGPKKKILISANTTKLLRAAGSQNYNLIFLSQQFDLLNNTKMVVLEKSNYLQSVIWDYHKMRNNQLFETGVKL